MIEHIVEGAAELQILRLGNRNCFRAAKSMFQFPGPFRKPIPVFPNVPAGFCANAAVLNQALIWSCLLRSPDGRQFPTTSAVSPPIPVNELSRPALTVRERLRSR